ncbi:unnamed protein product [Adineta ricciae]|uniref:PLAC8 family protein n=1 Tax=Adineta ricciae TaxID=249248 RepID=A0A815W7X0_ADIRI|nr:unnamed protein product [Adineta ricciae]
MCQKTSGIFVSCEPNLNSNPYATVSTMVKYAAMVVGVAAVYMVKMSQNWKITLSVLHIVVSKRARLRQRYGLVEDACGDCFITCCCPACAICQEAREMKKRGCPPPPLIVIHQPAMSLSSAADFDANH